MDRRAPLLAGLGLLVSLYSLDLGALSAGYGMSGVPILLRVGVALLGLGVFTALPRRVTARWATLGAVATTVAVFLVGVRVMHYDLAVTPPANGTHLTTERLVRTQLELTLTTLPVPAGYVAGVLASDGRRFAAAVPLPVGMVFGWVAGTALATSAGAASGFTGAFFFVVTFHTSVAGLVPLGVMARLDGSW